MAFYISSHDRPPSTASQAAQVQSVDLRLYKGGSDQAFSTTFRYTADACEGYRACPYSGIVLDAARGSETQTLRLNVGESFRLFGSLTVIFNRYEDSTAYNNKTPTRFAIISVVSDSKDGNTLPTKNTDRSSSTSLPTGSSTQTQATSADSQSAATTQTTGAITYPIGGEIWKLNSVEYPSKQVIRWNLPSGVAVTSLKISQSNKSNCTTTPCAVYSLTNNPLSGKFYSWIVGNAIDAKGHNIRIPIGYYRFKLTFSNSQTVESGQIYFAPAPIAPKP